VNYTPPLQAFVSSRSTKPLPQPTTLAYWAGARTNRYPKHYHAIDANGETALAFEIAAILTARLHQGRWLPQAMTAAKMNLEQEITKAGKAYETASDRMGEIIKLQQTCDAARMTELEKSLKALDEERCLLDRCVASLKNDLILEPHIRPVFENGNTRPKITFAIHAHRLLIPHIEKNPDRCFSLPLMPMHLHYRMPLHTRVHD
jgi:hypothetical protein